MVISFETYDICHISHIRRPHITGLSAAPTCHPLTMFVTQSKIEIRQRRLLSGWNPPLGKNGKTFIMQQNGKSDCLEMCYWHQNKDNISVSRFDMLYLCCCEINLGVKRIITCSLHCLQHQNVWGGWVIKTA